MILEEFFENRIAKDFALIHYEEEFARLTKLLVCLKKTDRQKYKHYD